MKTYRFLEKVLDRINSQAKPLKGNVDIETVMNSIRRVHNMPRGACQPYDLAYLELYKLARSRGFLSCSHYNHHQNTQHHHIVALLKKATKNTRAHHRKAQACLGHARSLIQDQRNWTQKAFCRDKNGNSLGGSIANAHSFCLLGALEMAQRKVDKATANTAEGALRAHLGKKYGDTSIVIFNDKLERKHREVVAVLQNAISALKVTDSKVF